MAKIATHDFVTGYYKFKTKDDESLKVYMNVIEDSIIVYPHSLMEKIISVDTSSFR